MSKTALLLIAVLLASMLALPAGQAFARKLAYTGCSGVTSPPASNAAYEQTVVELVNAQRASNGNLPPLKRIDPLDQASRYHAIDLGQDSYFEHNTFDRNAMYQLVQVCDIWQRISAYYTSANVMGENIASGQSTPEQVMQSWMNSSGHRGNILSPDYREIGVGYYPDGMYGASWVQDFGRRNNIYPLVINREDDTVNTRNVSLYIYGQGVWSEMRLRNDDGAWGSWQPFQSQVSWTLANLPGERSVSVELRQGIQTHIASDTIFFIDPSGSAVKVYLPFVRR